MGSFLPVEKEVVFNRIKMHLQRVIDLIAGSEQNRLIHSWRRGTLRVKGEDRRLQTCFKYVVFDRDGCKVMTVKIYDKTLDLMGRDGCLPVGSRFSSILGSK